MPVIRIPTPLRSYTGGLAEVNVQGDTAGAAMEDLMIQYPAFRTHLYKTDGTLRSFVNLYLQGKNLRELDGTATALSPEAVLILIPSIAGG